MTEFTSDGKHPQPFGIDPRTGFARTALRVRLAGDSIMQNGDHFTNGFDDQNRPISFKINGEPVSEQTYFAALHR